MGAGGAVSIWLSGLQGAGGALPAGLPARRWGHGQLALHLTPHLKVHGLAGLLHKVASKRSLSCHFGQDKHRH